MKQTTMTYTRSVTVTHSDDCPYTDEQLLYAVDHDDGEDNQFGIFVVEDEISDRGSCTTDITEEPC